jgi:hypothetical protein
LLLHIHLPQYDIDTSEEALHAYGRKKKKFMHIHNYGLVVWDSIPDKDR